ncbi:MAG TPA: ABC transporter ATP-binding protein [Candidatus Limnocylindria bacterium]|nr:ABC transporter ATP-binding protein [Candidatus Limnocylindria bacterium]
MLTVTDLRITYRGMQGTVEALRGVSFEVDEGEFFTLLGPSGCGKTSTLRCIAGLETPTSGTIAVGGATLFSTGPKRVNVAAHRRGFGMVFQSYAIWPHMSVFDNVAFPLIHGVQRLGKREARERALNALGLVQLQDVADRPAPYLSGGQQQRVALARALALEPKVLLLDEPLSNLDAKLRDEMRHELKTLVRRLGITTLYVTHDQLEALSMSDRVAVMHAGVIEQLGRPRDVYQAPASSFTARFLGRTNVLDGTANAHGVTTQWGAFRCEVPEWATPGARVALGFRPESITITREAREGLANVLVGSIVGHTFNGESAEYVVDITGKTVQARGDAFDIIAEGARAYLTIPPERCFVLALSEHHKVAGGSTDATDESVVSIIPDAQGRVLP